MQSSPSQAFRFLNEALFVLVGAMLLWLALSGRYPLFDPRRPSWLILAAVLILWGAWTWNHTRVTRAGRDRLAMKIGGGSVAIVGILMLSLAWTPFRWADLLLGAAGSIFVVRGILSAAILTFS